MDIRAVTTTSRMRNVIYMFITRHILSAEARLEWSRIRALLHDGTNEEAYEHIRNASPISVERHQLYKCETFKHP